MHQVAHPELEACLVEWRRVLTLARRQALGAPLRRGQRGPTALVVFLFLLGVALAAGRDPVLQAVAALPLGIIVGFWAAAAWWTPERSGGDSPEVQQLRARVWRLFEDTRGAGSPLAWVAARVPTSLRQLGPFLEESLRASPKVSHPPSSMAAMGGDPSGTGGSSGAPRAPRGIVIPFPEGGRRK